MASTIVVGGSYNLNFTLTLDSAVFNLAAATITLYYKKPDGTEGSVACVILDSAAGTCRYVAATTFFTIHGSWRFHIEVAQGANLFPSEEFGVYVYPAFGQE